MDSDKYFKPLELWGISTLYILMFMPFKNTTAFTCNLVETVLDVKT